MPRKNLRLLIVGAMLLVVAVGLAFFGFTTNNPSPVPALGSLAIAIVSFIFAVYFISVALRGLPNIESTSLLHRLGVIVFAIGAITTIYAAIAFFVIKSLPPNNATGRLPSLYLLFAGLSVLFLGTVVRNFRLR